VLFRLEYYGQIALKGSEPRQRPIGIVGRVCRAFDFGAMDMRLWKYTFDRSLLNLGALKSDST
jgi:hypothetical protein